MDEQAQHPLGNYEALTGIVDQTRQVFDRNTNNGQFAKNLEYSLGNLTITVWHQHQAHSATEWSRVIPSNANNHWS
jgi:hypothetical protein